MRVVLGETWAIRSPVCISERRIAQRYRLIVYFAGRERSRSKVFLLGGAGLLSVVLIVIGVELKLREEHDVVKGAAGTEVVCHHA